MKIGLFFGSYNPIHVGHLIIAQMALNETPLDKIWFMVSPQNPFKNKKSLLGEYDRLRMVEMATEDHPQMEASNFEFFLPKPSYTIDTLTQLNEKYPSYDFSLIMGEDNLDHLHKWKNYEAILKYYKIFAYPRRGSNGSGFQKFPQVTKFDLPLLDISATQIRNMIGEGKDFRYLVVEPVYDYLRSRGLYVH